MSLYASSLHFHTLLIGGSSYSQQNSTPDHTSPSKALTVTIPSSEDHTPMGTPPQAGHVMVMECPPQTLMCNESEGDPWIIDITLMYAQDLPYQSSYYNKGGATGMPAGSSARGVAKKKDGPREKRGNEKSLRELLEEQDIGKAVDPLPTMHSRGHRKGVVPHLLARLPLLIMSSLIFVVR